MPYCTYSFWRHGFSKQVLPSLWKYVKLKLERPTNQGDVACVPLRKSDTKFLWVYAEYSLSVFCLLWVCRSGKVIRSCCGCMLSALWVLFACSECVKSVLMLETRFSEAGAPEWLKISKIEAGASNKSGRRSMPAIKEKWYQVVVSVFWVFVECYLRVLSVSNRC